MTIQDLETFFDQGWNGHDVDALMTFMVDDCVFEGAAGSEACGTRYEGRERVREAFARIFAAVPDVRFADARHFVAGDRGVSERLFTGTMANGKKVEVNGCDLFTFRGGKIAVKSSYLPPRRTIDRVGACLDLARDLIRPRSCLLARLLPATPLLSRLSHEEDEVVADRQEDVTQDDGPDRNGGPSEATAERGHHQQRDEAERRERHDDPLSAFLFNIGPPRIRRSRSRQSRNGIIAAIARKPQYEPSASGVPKM
jgi:ketosteroid isomerase-like protein